MFKGEGRALSSRPRRGLALGPLRRRRQRARKHSHSCADAADRDNRQLSVHSRERGRVDELCGRRQRHLPPPGLNTTLQVVAEGLHFLDGENGAD